MKIIFQPQVYSILFERLVMRLWVSCCENCFRAQITKKEVVGTLKEENAELHPWTLSDENLRTNGVVTQEQFD